MSILTELNNKIKLFSKDYLNDVKAKENNKNIQNNIEQLDTNNKRLIERNYDTSCIVNVKPNKSQPQPQPQPQLQPQLQPQQYNLNQPQQYNKQQQYNQQQQQYNKQQQQYNQNQNHQYNQNQQQQQQLHQQKLRFNNNVNNVNNNLNNNVNNNVNNVSDNVNDNNDIRSDMNQQIDNIRFDNQVHLSNGLVPVNMEHIYSGNLFQNGVPIPKDIQSNYPLQSKEIQKYRGNKTYNGHMILQQKSKTAYRNDFNERMEALSPFHQQRFSPNINQYENFTNEGGILLRENPINSQGNIDIRNDIKSNIRDNMNDRLSSLGSLSSIKPLPDGKKNTNDNYIPNPNVEIKNENKNVEKLRFQEMMPVMSNY